jgi:anti-sigma factor RsiW
MRTMNERPVCHRSEDLVTYLYNEASAAEAQDFASHVETCEACRAEFAVFSQVHESILLWRNEALGSAFNPASQAVEVPAEATTDSRQFVRHERKLPALAALREFFNVSPLWLRGATAFAALLLCVLGVLTISRMLQRQPQAATNDTQPGFSQRDIDQAVQKGIDEGMARANRANLPLKGEMTKTVRPQKAENRIQLAANQSHPRSQRSRSLTRQERIQLAADLRLTPGRDEEELPFVFPDEPNQ